MKRIFTFLIVLFLGIALIGCNDKSIVPDNGEQPQVNIHEILKESYPKNDIYYQIFVRSFADSDGDGIGDLKGITNKLSYLTDLGITALWLTPIHPTISNHGYDIVDYYDINPDFGTMADFEELLKEAHKLDIKIIMDAVFNHTSEHNNWYKEALNDLDSSYRDFYIWPSNAKPGQAANESFSFTRDLNLRNPKVVDELEKILLFYLEKGVDGFRFDAVKHFFSKDYDKNFSSSPNFEGGMVLRELKQRVRKEHPNVYFVGEYFDYSINMYKDYYLGADSMFNFEMAQMLKEGRYSDLQLSLRRIYSSLDEFSPYAIDAPFITNHDLNRFASDNDNIENIKLSTSILLTLPGNPFIYYGEELGMKGVRREGVTIPGYEDEKGNPLLVYDEARRQPFLWDVDDDAMTKWFPLVDGNNEVARYSKQLNDPNSLLNHYQKLIKIRKDNPALRYGKTITRVNDINGAVAFIREIEHGDYKQTILIVHNTVGITKELNIEVIKDLYGSQTLLPMQTYIAEIESKELVFK